MLNVLKKIEDNIEKVITHENASIRWLLACFAAGGHVLLEDLPGTGKTTLAKTLAKSWPSMPLAPKIRIFVFLSIS